MLENLNTVSIRKFALYSGYKFNAFLLIIRAWICGNSAFGFAFPERHSSKVAIL